MAGITIGNFAIPVRRWVAVLLAPMSELGFPELRPCLSPVVSDPRTQCVEVLAQATDRGITRAHHLSCGQRVRLRLYNGCQFSDLALGGCHQLSRRAYSGQ